MFNILALLLLLGEAAHAFLLMGGTGHPQGREPKPLNISIVPQPCVKNCTDFIAYTNVSRFTSIACLITPKVLSPRSVAILLILQMQLVDAPLARKVIL
ncbi:hypothetical protein BDN72DRAFT_343928 [Pluteus cervinus]|uniref:Uncharacterized protein n=1 Tax=Pluteus cervinus TaxID=181527 RepID=A0ACD3B337_9AGAR|nr:hypothetical protein BDN72DRAFT_343928 [Pluteus cervinus]